MMEIGIEDVKALLKLLVSHSHSPKRKQKKKKRKMWIDFGCCEWILTYDLFWEKADTTLFNLDYLILKKPTNMLFILSMNIFEA